MKIQNNQPAPDFKAMDVFGNPVALSGLKGKKVLLTFFRTAGCPVCNLRFHVLKQVFNQLKNKEVVFIAVYASQKENMLKFIGSDNELTQNTYPIFIADPQRELYKLYHTEKSMLKLMSSLLFHGGFSNVNTGKKLFKTSIKDDGPIDLINADFLIDKNGKVVTAYYGKHSGDFVPIETIEKFAASKV